MAYFLVAYRLSTYSPNLTNGDCTYGDIRLVGGGNMYEFTGKIVQLESLVNTSNLHVVKFTIKMYYVFYYLYIKNTLCLQYNFQQMLEK